MDVEAITRRLRAFIVRHNTEFSGFGTRQSQLLELGAITVASRHYELEGYDVAPRNLIADRFRVKLGSAGYPWNFSWFEASRGSDVFELHTNLAVASAYGRDNGVYVVDVAVIRTRSIRRPARQSEWVSVRNRDLLTFIEAKAIVIYPMLIAQFIGIVHEIKPGFLRDNRPRRFLSQGHFDPALVSLGYLHGRSAPIVQALPERGFRIRIVPSFDDELTSLRFRDDATSPLARGRDGP